MNGLPLVKRPVLLACVAFALASAGCFGATPAPQPAGDESGASAEIEPFAAPSRPCKLATTERTHWIAREWSNAPPDTTVGNESFVIPADVGELRAEVTNVGNQVLAEWSVRIINEGGTEFFATKSDGQSIDSGSGNGPGGSIQVWPVFAETPITVEWSFEGYVEGVQLVVSTGACAGAN